MDFGKLDQLIEIKEATNTLDSLGEATTTWSAIAECYAKQTSRPGKEFFQAGRVYNEQHDFFLIRHRTGITAQMRVETSDGTQYEITDVLKSERRGESMTLVTKRVY